MKKRAKPAEEFGTYFDEKRLDTYYRIFISISEWARKPISTIAKDIGHTGRGKRRSTVASYLKKMYDLEISWHPHLIMKTFQKPKRKAFFLKKRSQDRIYQTFERLAEQTNYALFLSGECNYYVTSRNEDIDFDEFGVEIVEESMLYTPIFIKPLGWKNDFSEATKKIENFSFKKGYLKRDIQEALKWSDLDFEIFTRMKDNGRKRYSDVAKEIEVHSTTVKRHFMDNILPNCEFVHYFFPMGYKFYNKAFFLIRSEYELSLVRAFRLLPCTTYIFPYEKMMGCIIFHRDMTALMTMIEKLKIEGIIDSFSMFTPLKYEKK